MKKNFAYGIEDFVMCCRSKRVSGTVELEWSDLRLAGFTDAEYKPLIESEKVTLPDMKAMLVHNLNST